MVTGLNILGQLPGEKVISNLIQVERTALYWIVQYVVLDLGVICYVLSIIN